MAKEGLDAILAASVYEQNLSVLFLDDGVFQLVADQQSAHIQQKSFSSILKAFSLYDIEQVYACASSLRKRGLNVNDLTINVIPLENEQLQQLMYQQETLLCF